MRDQDLACVFEVLAQPSRLAVYRLLAASESSGMSASEIADRLGVPASTLTFHLDRLRLARLISRRREGRFNIYTVNAEMANALAMLLTGRRSPRLTRPAPVHRGAWIPDRGLGQA